MDLSVSVPCSGRVIKVRRLQNFGDLEAAQNDVQW